MSSFSVLSNIDKSSKFVFKKHFLKMSAVELLLKLLVHVIWYSILRYKKLLLTIKHTTGKNHKVAYLIAYFYDSFI